MKKFFASAFLATAVVGCGGEIDTEVGQPAVEIETEKFRLSMKTKFHTEGELVKFMTASASVVTVESEFYRGKPWVAMVFEPGAEPGVDLPLHHEWGVVPDNLEFDYSPDMDFEPGAYDMVAMIYAGTEVTPEMISGSVLDLPFPANKDVTTFTLDQSSIKEKDPDFAPGMIRVNLGTTNTGVVCENRWSTEEHSEEERFASFTNTYLILP